MNRLLFTAFLSTLFLLPAQAELEHLGYGKGSRPFSADSIQSLLLAAGSCDFPSYGDNNYGPGNYGTGGLNAYPPFYSGGNDYVPPPTADVPRVPADYGTTPPPSADPGVPRIPPITKGAPSEDPLPSKPADAPKGSTPDPKRIADAGKQSPKDPSESPKRDEKPEPWRPAGSKIEQRNFNGRPMNVLLRMNGGTQEVWLGASGTPTLEKDPSGRWECT